MEVVEDLAGAQVVDLVEVMEDLMMLLEEVLVLWRRQFQVFQETTILYLLKCLRHLSCVMVKQMVVTMLIQKLSVKHSISVPMMEMED